MINDKCDNLPSSSLQHLCNGLSIFPLILGGKKPVPSFNWEPFPLILSTQEQLKSWFDGTDNNIVFATRAVSRSLAKFHADDAFQNRIHQDTQDAILDTKGVETGSEGVHMPIRYNSQEVRERNSAANELRNFFLWGDKGMQSQFGLKADGGYVAAGSSMHANGKSESDTDHQPLIAHILFLQNAAEVLCHRYDYLLHRHNTPPDPYS
jgi:hypothetical protein